MCLNVTSKVPKRTKFVNGKATAYKIFYKDDKTLISQYMGTVYKPGFNKAVGHPVFVDRLYGGAIHVCLSIRSAKTHASFEDCIVVPVTVYKKDFIAESETEAGFKQVFLSKANYLKALKATKKYELVQK